MDGVQDMLQTELEQVRRTLVCDFAAVARMDRRENRIRWTGCSGNITNRIQQMTKKPGAGITGHVVRHGRPYVVDRNTPDYEQIRKLYPIMLAEQLDSVIAVPLYKDEQIDGVLLAGNRSERAFGTDEVNQTVEIAGRLARYL